MHLHFASQCVGPFKDSLSLNPFNCSIEKLIIITSLDAQPIFFLHLFIEIRYE